MAVAVSQFGERTFGDQAPLMNDADGIAEFFGFAHHVGGEEHGLAFRRGIRG